MQSQSNKICYGVIFVSTLLLVILSRTRGCPQDFDCNSYIAMASSITYDPAIAGHHAMRMLPSILAGALTQLGIPLELAFHLLSGGLYIAFGLLTFWFFTKFTLTPVKALAFTFLCLGAHYAIKIPLQIVYQTCDMMTYPLALLLIYCSIRKQTTGLIVFAFISLMVRQNLFILGELSLLYCFLQTKQTRMLVSAGLLAAGYITLQNYFHANSTFAALLQPPADFFTKEHLWFVLTDSKILELIIPLVPLLVFYAKPMIMTLIRYWHIALYIAITAGQPFLGYHMTGANLPRLALQGVICLYFLAGLVSVKQKWSAQQVWLFLIYAVAMYITWGIHNRLIIMAVFGVVFGWMAFKQRPTSVSAGSLQLESPLP